MSATTWSTGSAERDAALVRVGDDRPRRLELVVLDERPADRDALRLEERVRHRAADEQRVDLAEQVLDDLDLVRDLRAAEDGDERALGRAERVAEILQFLLHQQPGRRLRQELRDALDRRVRAVRRAERVVHVDVGERRQLRRERRVVLLLLRVEAEVLEQDDLAARRARASTAACAVAPDAVVGERHRAAEQLRERAATGCDGVLWVRLALRPAEVRGEDDRRARARARTRWSAATRGCACRRDRRRP